MTLDINTLVIMGSTIAIIGTVVGTMIALFVQANRQNSALNARIDRLEEVQRNDKAELRAEMKEGFARVDKNHAELRTEMKADTDAIRVEMREGFARVDKNHAELRAEMKEGFASFKEQENTLRRISGQMEVMLMIHGHHPPAAHAHEEQQISEATGDD